MWRTDSLEKTLMLEKNWRQEQKGTIEDEMVGWHHQLSGHEFAQAPGVGDGQGSLMCCSPWSLKELDMTEQLNWSEPIASPVKSRGNKRERKSKPSEGVISGDISPEEGSLFGTGAECYGMCADRPPWGLCQLLILSLVLLSHNKLHLPETV